MMAMLNSEIDMQVHAQQFFYLISLIIIRSSFISGRTVQDDFLSCHSILWHFSRNHIISVSNRYISACLLIVHDQHQTSIIIIVQQIPRRAPFSSLARPQYFRLTAINVGVAEGNSIINRRIMTRRKTQRKARVDTYSIFSMNQPLRVK